MSPDQWHDLPARLARTSLLKGQGVRLSSLTVRLESLTYRGSCVADESRAIQALHEKLKLILAGEPPYGIFVRWKPLSEQAIGWNPDLNDGVRMNIRPFVQADILRKPPNIRWTKDRGKEPERDRDEYPWFWKW